MSRMYRNPKRAVKIITIALFISVVYILTQIFLLIRTVNKNYGLSPVLVYQIAMSDSSYLRSNENITNILLLGMRGGNMESGDLTDSLLIISLNKKPPISMTMISVPRDIWSLTLKDKINSAYHYGEEQKDGLGLLLSKTIIEEVIGQPIHYTFLIDFSHFTKLIDLIGGIEVDIEQSFTDVKYPIDGREDDLCSGDPLYRCRYKTVSFIQGKSHMNGETALQYVRSRHSAGEEGTDYARGKRQQRVIMAIKNKLMQPSKWFSFGILNKFENELSKMIASNTTLGETLLIGRIFMTIKDENVRHLDLENLFTSPPVDYYDGKYVLVPASDWQSIHKYIIDQLSN